MYTVKQLDHGRQNNFDLIRLLAATSVIFSHSYLVTNNFANEPLIRSLGFLDMGALGVCIFFTISGYLVLKSLYRQPTLSRFVWARALRIFPALFVSALFCALFVGPLTTTVPLTDYFKTRAVYGFIWRLTTQHNFQNMLPGVFAHNPYPYHVNSPTWTLPAEMALYAGVTIFGIGLLLWRRDFKALKKCIPLFAVLLFFFFTMTYTLGYIFYISVWGCFFLAGMCFYWLNEKIKISLRLLLSLLIICMLLHVFAKPEWAKYAIDLLIIYGVFVFAYHPKLQIKNFIGHVDISYGLYIYAFPIQQYIVFKYPLFNQWNNFFITMALAIPLALVSWLFIEKPALSLKSKPLKQKPNPLHRIKKAMDKNPSLNM